MPEIMYDKNSLLIAAFLFLSMAVAIEIGGWLGVRLATRATDSLRTQINALQASLLGILALLLGFTFSQSLQRYEARSAAVVGEANAIGTANLRIELLPTEVREHSRALMHRYLDNRVATGGVSMDRLEERDSLLAEGFRLQAELWAEGVRAIGLSDRPTALNLYLQSLNEMIDANTSRDAALGRHVPELALLLLFTTFILTGALLGYAAGIGGRRASNGTYVLVLLIVVLVFIIIDLDRPRRGLIEVDQSSLTDLQV